MEGEKMLNRYLKLSYPEGYHARYGVARKRITKIVSADLYDSEQIAVFRKRGVKVEPYDPDGGAVITWSVGEKGEKPPARKTRRAKPKTARKAG